MTAVFKVTLYIVNHDRLHTHEVAGVLENTRYANDCIYPRVLGIEARDIGEWDDSNPLNFEQTAATEIRRLFGE